MPLSRPALMIIIGLLTIVSIGAVVAYLRERDKSHGVEIRMDERGVRIEGR